MSSDHEAQEDELLALTSIYDDDTVTICGGTDQPSGHISAIPHLPQPFCVRATLDAGKCIVLLHLL